MTITLASTRQQPLLQYLLEDEVEFETEAVFDKGGFCDGDMLVDLYYEYMEKVKGVDFKEQWNRGLYGSRPKLKTLFKLIREQKIRKVVVEHKDLLTRWSFGVYKEFFDAFGVEIEWMDEGVEKSYEQELVDDMITLMSSFSSRSYGKRIAENRKQRKLQKMMEMAALQNKGEACQV